jgi:hypothetical protein
MRQSRRILIGLLLVDERHVYTTGYIGFQLTKINHKLDDLQTSDPLLPPDADSTSTLEVVPVHNNMDHQV